MATTVNENTFLSSYNDDYRDSDHYHRILFNNGRALQARELTQSQTIIQKEIERIAKFIFKPGGLFNTSYGTANTGFDPIPYVRVASLPVGYNIFVGKTFTNQAGVKALVKAVIPSTSVNNTVGTDAYNTLLVKYTDANSTTSNNTTLSVKFNPADTLTATIGSVTYELDVSVDEQVINSTGYGSYIEIPDFNTYAAGHLLFVEKQQLVLDKFSPSFSGVIGFELNEEIFNTSDNVALYDNSGSTPNLTSPGADRLKITLTLKKKDDKTAGKTFYPLMKFNEGYVTNLNNPDNILASLGGIIYNRAFDTNGNFVVEEQNGNLELTITTKHDSTDYLLYQLSNGIAFVNGSRYENQDIAPLKVIKPRNLVNDVTTLSNEFISARYGNYFLTDGTNTKGLLDVINNFDSVGIYSAIATGGSAIGKARIRNIDNFNNQFRLHVFDVEMYDNNSLGDARSVGKSSNSYGDLVAIDNNYNIVDKSENDLLFKIADGAGRVNNVTDGTVTFNIGKVYTATATGNSATFSTGGNTFTDQEQWIVEEVANSNNLISSPSVSGTPNSSATITGLTDGAVRLFGYERKTGIRKTKTLISNQTQTISFSGTGFQLLFHDIYKFKSVIDSTTNEDITQRFIFNNGQRDNFYAVGSGKLKAGAIAPTGNIVVTFDYFTHSAGDFFAGSASYPDLEYDKIPLYNTTNGRQIRLTDVIDFRSVKDKTSQNFTGSGSNIQYIPRNTDTIDIGELSVWESRIDIVSINANGNIEVHSGVTSPNPADPEDIPSSSMKLHYIELNPYHLHERDHIQTKYDNRGYKMSDIRRMERRVENLEELTTLSLAEIELERTVIPDRVKQGMTGDTFTSNIQSLVSDKDYKATIRKEDGVLAPMRYWRDIGLKYDSDASFGVKLHGSTVWPVFTEEVMVDQTQATEYQSVNRFELIKFIGSGFVEPAVDTYELRREVDVSYTSEFNESLTTQGDTVMLSQGNQNEDA
jgi:hypothetical protein